MFDFTCPILVEEQGDDGRRAEMSATVVFSGDVVAVNNLKIGPPGTDPKLLVTVAYKFAVLLEQVVADGRKLVAISKDLAAKNEAEKADV